MIDFYIYFMLQDIMKKLVDLYWIFFLLYFIWINHVCIKFLWKQKSFVISNNI
jgi:hypothetical protein